jgi:hypothetical protein
MILKTIQWDIIMNNFYVNYLFIREILMEIEVIRHNFEKSPNIKFYNNPSEGWEPSCAMRADRQTDRQAGRQTDRKIDSANSRFSQFCNCAEKEDNSRCWVVD